MIESSVPDEWRDLPVEKRPGKSACVVRYGGFGDLVMASCLFPALRAEGYDHICVNVSERWEVLKADPNVDEVLTQKTNQVPQDELLPYWEHLGKSFDRLINLSGSIEGNLLPVGERVEKIKGQKVLIPEDPKYGWSEEKRREKLNRNYIEETFKFAGMEFSGKHVPKFFATRNERRRAESLAGTKKNIMWVLSGSSVHKAYPWVDAVIARILMQTNDVRFHLVGDDYCRILEQGWEKEDRVSCWSGEMSIRDTLALAQQMDIVIGPETGVLNAVSSERVRKIIYLSHSTEENLTKHWRNTLPLTGDVHCYPCHRLHHGFRDCNRDEHTRAAMCAAAINPDLIEQDILKTLYGDQRIVA